MKVLVDAMSDGLEIKLKEKGYDAYSVKKLVDEGKKLKSDYSILKYAELNDMVLITEDIDNIEGCKENDIKCASFGQNEDLRVLLEKLETFKLGNT